MLAARVVREVHEGRYGFLFQSAAVVVPAPLAMLFETLCAALRLQLVQEISCVYDSLTVEHAARLFSAPPDVAAGGGDSRRYALIGAVLLGAGWAQSDSGLLLNKVGSVRRQCLRPS